MNQEQMKLIERQLNEAILRDTAPYILISIAVGIFWLITIIDILKSDFKEPSNKMIWILIVTFTAPVGNILYYIIGTNQKKDNKNEAELLSPSRSNNHAKREDALKENKWF